MQLVLKVMVPVYVYVETQHGNIGVDKVVVDDEALDLSTAELTDLNETWSDKRKRALLCIAKHAANDACNWPSWEFGF